MNNMSMKITRNICGTDVEIELTMSELSEAFDEVRRYNTYEMLNERLMQEEGIKDEIPDELFEQMVKEVMEEQEGFDEHMGSNIFPAMNAVIEKHKDELKKEEPWGLFEIECTQVRKRTWTVRAKNAEDADHIFEEWRNHHTYEYDSEMADADIDEDNIDSAYACEGNPEYADIIVEGE